jgi:hypothetical protein
MQRHESERSTRYPVRSMALTMPEVLDLVENSDQPTRRREFDHYVCRIRRLGLLAEQVASPVHSQMEIIEMPTWPNSITGQLCGWAGKHTVHLLEGET